jgi:hypothetical protein
VSRLRKAFAFFSLLASSPSSQLAPFFYTLLHHSPLADSLSLLYLISHPHFRIATATRTLQCQLEASHVCMRTSTRPFRRNTGTMTISRFSGGKRKTHTTLSQASTIVFASQSLLPCDAWGGNIAEGAPHPELEWTWK